MEWVNKDYSAFSKEVLVRGLHARSFFHRYILLSFSALISSSIKASRYFIIFMGCYLKIVGLIVI